jgi:hypothetical protein
MAWSKSNFKYSLEYFWVILFRKMGKASTKILPLNLKKEGGKGHLAACKSATQSPKIK